MPGAMNKTEDNKNSIHHFWIRRELNSCDLKVSSMRQYCTKVYKKYARPLNGIKRAPVYRIDLIRGKNDLCFVSHCK